MGKRLGAPIMPTVRRVDSQGRIALPRHWRSKNLKGVKEVVVVEQKDESLLIRPRRRADITRYFDSIEVDVDPKYFADYASLRGELLKERRETKSN